MSEDGKKSRLPARFIRAMIENSNVEVKSLYPLIHRMKISLIEGAGVMLLLSLDEDVYWETVFRQAIFLSFGICCTV